MFRATMIVFSAVRATAMGIGLLVSTPSHATTLVAIWTKERVAVAVDSLARTGEARASVCKIHVRDGLAFAFSGPISYPPTAFSAYDLADSAICSNCTFDENVARIESALDGPVVAALTGLRRTEEDLLEWDGIGAAFSLVVIGYEAGMARAYRSSRKADGKLTKGEWPPDDRPVTVFPTGFVGEITKILEEDFRPEAYDGPAAAARELVNLELSGLEDRDDPVSAGPVNVLVIDADGIRWDEPSPLCTD